MTAAQLHTWTEFFNVAHQLTDSGIDREEIVRSLAEELRPVVPLVTPAATKYVWELPQEPAVPIVRAEPEDPTSLAYCLKVWLGLPGKAHKRIKCAALHRELLDLGLPIPLRSRQFGQLMTANLMVLMGQLCCMESRSHGLRYFTFKPADFALTSCKALHDSYLSARPGVPAQQVNGALPPSAARARDPRVN